MKAVKETVRKYYKYTSETVTYTSPVFNSEQEALAGDGNIRMIEGSDYFAITQKALALFNTGKQITFEILEQNPNDVYGISNITFHNFVSAYHYPAFAIKDVEGSVNGQDWVTITSFKGSGNTYETTNTLDVSVPNYYKFLRFTTTNTDSRYGYGSGGHFVITFLRRKYVESTSSDYNFYKDVEVYKLPAKVDRTHYKYKDSEWVQPTLTANGSLGGSSFAVSSTCEVNASTAWKAFDGSTSTYGYCYFTSPNNNKGDYILYNPNGLNITQLTLNIYIVTQITVSYSDDGKTFTQCGYLSRGSTWGQGTVVVNVDTGNTYHKYYKIYFNNTAGVSQPQINDIKIKATQRTTDNGTVNDYDFYEDKTTYYAIGE